MLVEGLREEGCTVAEVAEAFGAGQRPERETPEREAPDREASECDECGNPHGRGQF